MLPSLITHAENCMYILLIDYYSFLKIVDQRSLALPQKSLMFFNGKK